LATGLAGKLLSVTYNGLKTASMVVKNRGIGSVRFSLKNRGFGVGLKTVNSPYFATTFKYHRRSQIIEDTVEPSFLSEKLITKHAR